MKNKLEKSNPLKTGSTKSIVFTKIYQGPNISMTGILQKTWEYSVCYDPGSVLKLFKNKDEL